MRRRDILLSFWAMAGFVIIASRIEAFDFFPNVGPVNLMPELGSTTSSFDPNLLNAIFNNGNNNNKKDESNLSNLGTNFLWGFSNPSLPNFASPAINLDTKIFDRSYNGLQPTVKDSILSNTIFASSLAATKSLAGSVSMNNLLPSSTNPLSRDALKLDNVTRIAGALQYSLPAGVLVNFEAGPIKEEASVYSESAVRLAKSSAEDNAEEKKDNYGAVISESYSYDKNGKLLVNSSLARELDKGVRDEVKAQSSPPDTQYISDKALITPENIANLVKQSDEIDNTTGIDIGEGNKNTAKEAVDAQAHRDETNEIIEKAAENNNRGGLPVLLAVATQPGKNLVLGETKDSRVAKVDASLPNRSVDKNLEKGEEEISEVELFVNRVKNAQQNFQKELLKSVDELKAPAGSKKFQDIYAEKSQIFKNSLSFMVKRYDPPTINIELDNGYSFKFFKLPQIEKNSDKGADTK